MQFVNKATYKVIVKKKNGFHFSLPSWIQIRIMPIHPNLFTTYNFKGLNKILNMEICKG